MLVGTEWIIDAFDCDAEKLREVDALREIFSQVVGDLQLKVIDEVWHQFPGERGITGFNLLSESHLACHTYPEYRTVTFNLYCCRTRPEWNWTENLAESLGAKNVKVQKVERGQKSNAGVSPAVAEASRFRTANFPNVGFGEVTIRERGRLPHWEKEGGIYFVTFRLADSLPKEVLQNLEFERESALKVLEKLDRNLSPTEKRKIDVLFSERLDDYLDKGYGSCVLKNDNLAKIVADSLLHFDGEHYDLFAWCVMPNHVHAVFRPLSGYDLANITHSWKSFTSKEINRALGKTGKFWQRESYDRLIRSQEEFETVIRYVADNPAKAGLKDWRWVSIARRYSAAVAASKNVGF